MVGPARAAQGVWLRFSALVMQPTANQPPKLLVADDRSGQVFVEDGN